MKLSYFAAAFAIFFSIASAHAAAPITASTDCGEWVKAQFPEGTLPQGARQSMIDRCKTDRQKIRDAGKKR